MFLALFGLVVGLVAGMFVESLTGLVSKWRAADGPAPTPPPQKVKPMDGPPNPPPPKH